MISNDVLDFAKPLSLDHKGASFDPWRVVLHYSAGSTLSSAKSALNARGLSYHVLIDPDGVAHQTRPFTRSALHAGRSNWKAAGGLTNSSSLSNDSIGICFINLGQYGYRNGDKWYYAYDSATKKYKMPAGADTKLATSLYEPGRECPWTVFQPKQIETCERILKDLVETYHIEEIVGHHDIAIDQKPDPGPLCPLEHWRVRFKKQGSLGLETKVKSPDGKLSLRDRPSTNGNKLAELRNGDTIHIRSVTYTSASKGLVPPKKDRALTGWASVDVDGSNKHAGFVHLAYLTRNPLAPEYQAALKGK